MRAAVFLACLVLAGCTAQEGPGAGATESPDAPAPTASATAAPTTTRADTVKCRAELAWQDDDLMGGDGYEAPAALGSLGVDPRVHVLSRTFVLDDEMGLNATFRATGADRVFLGVWTPHSTDAPQDGRVREAARQTLPSLLDWSANETEAFVADLRWTGVVGDDFEQGKAYYSGQHVGETTVDPSRLRFDATAGLDHQDIVMRWRAAWGPDDPIGRWSPPGDNGSRELGLGVDRGRWEEGGSAVGWGYEVDALGHSRIQADTHAYPDRASAVAALTASAEALPDRLRPPGPVDDHVRCDPVP